MIKDKKLRPILIYFVVVVVCSFLIGFFGAKNVYASPLNEIYTIEEIYDMYNILEENRINPWDYGYSRLIISYVSNNHIYFCLFNEEIDFSNAYVQNGYVYYDFNESARWIDFVNGQISKNIEATRIVLGTTNISNVYLGNSRNYRIIYSSYDLRKPDGTVFFWATPPTTLSLVMEEMKNQNQLQPLSQVVCLIPIGLGLVVSFLAFRKVLKLLRSISYQA